MNMPTVFISSTKEDLELFRSKALDAVNRAYCHPIMMEYFEAGNDRPFVTCMDKVQPCDVLVVIVAHRYGWIPDDQPRPEEQKSITWLECEKAEQDGKEILPFLLHDRAPWSEKEKEEFKLSEAMRSGTATIEDFTKVKARVKKLEEFKTWLRQSKSVNFFTSPESLETAVLAALVQWKEKRSSGSQQSKTSATIVHHSVPTAYMEWLQSRCATLELRANLLKEGVKPPRLSSVYVPAPTIEWREKERKTDQKTTFEHNEDKLALLLDRFTEESLYVPGLAGSGKSIFCQWVVFLLCNGKMPEQVQSNPQQPIVEPFPASLKDKLPLLIPFREFWPCVSAKPGQREMGRKELESALRQYVETKLDGLSWNDVEYFINDGRSVLLWDGVDEIPISAGANYKFHYPREMIISGLRNCFPVWRKNGNRLLLTSRPYGISSVDEKELELPRSEVVELPQPLQQLFVMRWFTALEYGREMAAEMLAHLSEREELSQLTGNPVMLMAMCILFPEGGRLPQDKAELYSRAVDRILYNRYRDPAAEVDKVHNRLSVIAYGMHTGEGLGENRSTPIAEVQKEEIASMLQAYLDQQRYQEKGSISVSEAREDLLSRSGLLLPKDDRHASFYHLTFQEYLAAKRLIQIKGDGLIDAFHERAEVPEWRQTLSFAFGIILQENRSPEKNIGILNSMMKSVDRQKWSSLVLIGDLFEILNAKGYLPENTIVEKFVSFCTTAITKLAPLRDRFDLVRVLGLIGDPRIVMDLRQPPQGYVVIPKGKLKLVETGRRKEIDQAFYLSRYPVTNAQFRLFIDNGGYQTESWWSPEGWQYRQDNHLTEPEYWRHGRWNQPNFPVVGVCWYEAEAFCRWAGGRLPTEAEWQWAAGRGEREFPWGADQPTIEHANYDMNIGRTTPVGIYPAGATPDGLMDMAGNVLEWCEDWYDKDKDGRVLRGGSFSDNALGLRCSYRLWDNPVVRGSDVGFRVVRVPVLR